MAIIQPQVQRREQSNVAGEAVEKAVNLFQGMQQIKLMQNQQKLAERQLSETKRQYNVGKAYDSMNMAIKTLGQVIQGGEAAALEAFRPMLENMASLLPGMNNKTAKDMYSDLFNNSRLSTEQMISEAVRSAMGINELELGNAMQIVEQVDKRQTSGNLMPPQELGKIPITGVVQGRREQPTVGYPYVVEGIAPAKEQSFTTMPSYEQAPRMLPGELAIDTTKDRQIEVGMLTRMSNGAGIVTLSEDAKKKAPWNNMEDIYRSAGLDPQKNQEQFKKFYREVITNPENVKRLKEITGKSYDAEKNYAALYKDFNDNFFKFDEIEMQFVPGTNDFNITHSEDLSDSVQESNKENLEKLGEILDNQSIQPARKNALIQRYQNQIKGGGWREKYEALGEYLRSDPQAATRMLSVFGGAEPGKAQYNQQEVQRGIQRYIDTIYSSSTVDARIREQINQSMEQEERDLLRAQTAAIIEGVGIDREKLGIEKAKLAQAEELAYIQLQMEASLRSADLQTETQSILDKQLNNAMDDWLRILSKYEIRSQQGFASAFDRGDVKLAWNNFVRATANATGQDIKMTELLMKTSGLNWIGKLDLLLQGKSQSIQIPYVEGMTMPFEGGTTGARQQTDVTKTTEEIEGELEGTGF